MNTTEILRFAVRGLLANRVRSLLTMLGIIIGIAAVILLTALGNGASQYIQNQITGLGANSITVIGQAPSASSSRGSSSGSPGSPASLGGPNSRTERRKMSKDQPHDSRST